MLHLLVASFRALPLDLMVPVSARRGFCLDVFSNLFFYFVLLLFWFFSVLFLWVSRSKRTISPALSVWTPSHMRTGRNLPGSKCQKKEKKKVCDDILLWYWTDRGKMRRNRIVDISFSITSIDEIKISELKKKNSWCFWCTSNFKLACSDRKKKKIILGLIKATSFQCLNTVFRLTSLKNSILLIFFHRLFNATVATFPLHMKSH